MTWQDDVKAADEWRDKGDSGWELNLRRSAIRTALRDAVRKSETEGVAWLRESKLNIELERIVALGKAGHKDDNTDAIDLALTLQRSDLARELLEQGKPPSVPLWKEYQKGISALLHGRSYKAPDLKLKGWSATFLPHLRLIETIAAGVDTQAALKATDDAFLKRNGTKGMFDPTGVNGDGNAPVTWDVRKRAILAARNRS